MNCGPDECIKVIVVGNCGVGKTCLLHRFVRCSFIDRYTKTIGAEFHEKDVFCGGPELRVKLMLWDTAGQETSNALTQAYYSGSGVAVLAFSTVDRDSYTDVAKWKEKVEFVCGPIVMVLCQTKCDLFHESSITDREAVELAEAFQLPLFRVSSKDDFNVSQLFEFIVQQCLIGEEIEGFARPLNHLKVLDTKSGGAVNRVKEGKCEAMQSFGSPADPGLAVGKVMTSTPIALDGSVSSVPAAGYSGVKTRISQKKEKSTKTNSGMMSESSSVSKKSRNCKCALI